MIMQNKSLKAIAYQWERDSKRALKLAEKIRPHAGHSNDDQGTGDEGWTMMIELFERGQTLRSCAAELREFLNKKEGL
jgi:hypothetical protein